MLFRRVTFRFYHIYIFTHGVTNVAVAAVKGKCTTCVYEMSATAAATHGRRSSNKTSGNEKDSELDR